MIKSISLFHIIFPFVGLFLILIMFAGCAHENTIGQAFAEKTVQASSTLEKRGDLVNAVEDLRIALAVDPDNALVREKLNLMIARHNQEAERHLKAGLAVRNANPNGARSAFVEALRIRSDYPEAVAALRALQLELAEAVIQARTKKEARLAAIRARGKADVEEDEMDSEDYSLDIAISAFESGDYDTAIHEFGKMKTRYPNDKDIQLYLDRSWYNAGIARFTKKDYKRALASFAKVPKGFESVNGYVAKCRTALKIAGGGKVKPAQKKP